jgi:hypothetical protein
MVEIIAALAVLAVAGSAIHLFWPRKRTLTRQDIISDEALNAPIDLAKAIEKISYEISRLRSNLPPGSYATGGDMDQEQKENTHRWFSHKANSTQSVDWKKFAPTGDPMYWDGSTLRPRLKDVPQPSDSNSGTYRFKMPVANMTAEEVSDFKSCIDASMNGNNKPGIFLWPKNTGFTKLRNRGSRFLSSSNPLGDTAAFIGESCASRDNVYRTVNFRHRKGGRRG